MVNSNGSPLFQDTNPIQEYTSIFNPPSLSHAPQPTSFFHRSFPHPHAKLYIYAVFRKTELQRCKICTYTVLLLGEPQLYLNSAACSFCDFKRVEATPNFSKPSSRDPKRVAASPTIVSTHFCAGSEIPTMYWVTVFALSRT